MKVPAEHEQKSPTSPVNAANTHFGDLVEIMLNLFKSKLFKAYRVFSPEYCLLAGLTENFLRVLSGTLSPPKSQRQNLQKAHVNVKYGCSDAHESPVRLGELAR